MTASYERTPIRANIGQKDSVRVGSGEGSVKREDMAARGAEIDHRKQQAELLRAAGTVLLAGVHVIEHGYGRMALLPYIGGAGHWRCEFHPVGRARRVLFRYSSSAGFRYLASHAGGSTRRSISPAALAKAIMVSVPEDLKEQCQGDLPAEYARWLGMLRDVLTKGGVPAAFHEYTEDYTRWEVHGSHGVEHLTLPAPPGFVAPGQDRPLLEQPFWRPRLARWERLATGLSIEVLPAAIDQPEALDEIAQELARDLRYADPWQASELFTAALKAALVALQPTLPCIDAKDLVEALRDAGLGLHLIDEGHGFVTGMSLVSVDGELDAATFDAERLRRVDAALRELGVLPDPATRALVGQMMVGPVVAVLLIERQQGKNEAQKLAADVIKQAKVGAAEESVTTLVSGPAWHPRLDDEGLRVRIHLPSTPSPLDRWVDHESTATVVAGGEAPVELHGLPFKPWADAPATLDEWDDVAGQAEIDEPDFECSANLEAAAGVVIQERDGRVWVVSPTNGFGGYRNTFPKGRVGYDLSLQATAIKEAYEESGLQVEITGHLGDFSRTQTYTRYYMARRVGGTPADMGWESQAVRLAPLGALHLLLNGPADHQVLKALIT